MDKRRSTAMQRPADLATVRRFEAAGFRAWPASAVHYDGTWVVRLTAGHPAKRLNSVNPLDPGDVRDLADAHRARRPALRRLWPAAHLPAVAAWRARPDRAISTSEGWDDFGRIAGHARATSTTEAVDVAMDQIPLKDMGRFVARRAC